MSSSPDRQQASSSILQSCRDDLTELQMKEAEELAETAKPKTRNLAN